MEAILITLTVILGAVAAVSAVAASRFSRQRDRAREDAAELGQKLAEAGARLEETQGERDRLLQERQDAESVTIALAGVRECVDDVKVGVETSKEHALAAADGVKRIDGHLTGFARRLANPQSRGAFGEEALRNQLELLGLAEGRDFRRQVRESGGRRRIDYAVTLRSTTVGIDPKFALDPDLDGLADALIAGDEERLRPFARKLVDRAKELARKEYWAHLERSPAFVLMYCPVEGAQLALSSLANFSYEKFALEHGVYIVTPLQLGTTLGVIADVAHAEKRSEETEHVHRALMGLDQELAKFCDQYAKHGRQLAAAVTSYEGGAAMLSSRGGLGRMAKQLRGYSRRLFARPEAPRFQPVRDDVDQIAQGYRDAAEESVSDLRESA